MLLRKKAAEELKKKQERDKEERRRVVVQRCGKEKPIDNIPLEGLQAIVQEYYDHILACESSKYDLELQLMVNEYTIVDLTRRVTDLRG